MTNPLLHKTASTIKDLLVVSSFVSGFFATLSTILFTVFWPVFIDRLSTDLNVATRDDIAKITERMDQITGEDRVLRVNQGHSYVQEPIKQDDLVTLTLAAQLTERGKHCVLAQVTPLFFDSRDIPYPGESLLPVTQFRADQSRRQLTLEAPGNLQPGRVGVYLALRFNCPLGDSQGMTEIYEETPSIFFQIVPR